MRRVVVLALVVGCGDGREPPRNSNMAAIVDGRVELIDTATQDRAVVPDVVDAEYLAWSHDGSRLAILTTQQDLRVFDLATESFLTTVHGVERRQPLWSPDDQRLLLRGAIVSLDGTLVDLPGTAIHLAWSTNGHVVQHPDVDTDHCLSCTVEGACVEKVCSALAPEGDVFAVPRNRAIDYVRASDDQVLATIDCSSQTVAQRNDIPWSPRSVHVVGCPYDNTIKFFDLSTTATSSMADDGSPLAWSPDGEYLATTTNVIRMTDHASTPLPTRILQAWWAPNSEYWLGWSMPQMGDVLQWTVSIFRPTGAQTLPGSLLPGFLDAGPAPAFSPSARYFMLGPYTNALCDSASFTCSDRGPGTVFWLDDDRYLVLRPDGGLAVTDRATGASDDLATDVTAVAVRPQ